ncbi:MAG: hypothetical protein KF777_22715 [Planctomycetaceae bacterium]|nr:hypothetical protein [Planctomycetaceae bacterium]
MNQVKQEYNDFGQITSSAQQQDGSVTGGSPTVEIRYADGLDNTIRPTGVVYPDGRELTYDYGEGGNISDRASRIASIVDDDSTHLADYDYLGLGTAVVVDYTEPDVKYTLVNLSASNDEDTGDIYSGLDRFGRVKDCRWHNYGESADTARLKYGYDRSSNRLWREDTVARSLEKEFDELYSYDGLHRLKDMARGWLNGSRTALTSETFGQCWSLDATGNWSGFREDDDGNGTWNLVQSRTANPVNEIAGITNTVGAAWVQPGYDPAGNITTIPQPADPTLSYTATYDAWNRLVKLTDSLDIVQENEYDARTFRTVRKDYEAGDLSETRHFYYTPDWRCVEERIDSSSDAERQFVWSPTELDRLIQIRVVATSPGPWTVDYVLQDECANSVAFTDETGQIRNRLTFSAYGRATAYSADYLEQPLPPLLIFGGHLTNSSSPLLPMRCRHYDPSLGAFVSRDAARGSGGSLYEYALSIPTSFVDYLGLLPGLPRVGRSNFFDNIPTTHHWTPQARDLKDILQQACGAALKAAGMTTDDFMNKFTTQTPAPGWGRGGASLHNNIQYGLRDGHYNEQVRRIYEDNRSDCCDLLREMSDLIYRAYEEGLRMTTGSAGISSQFQGPIYVPLHPYGDPGNHVGGGQALQQIIECICRGRPRPPKPRHVPIPYPLPVADPKRVPRNDMRTVPVDQDNRLEQLGIVGVIIVIIIIAGSGGRAAPGF